MNAQYKDQDTGKFISELTYSQEFCSFTDDNRAIALARSLDISLDEIQECNYQETRFDADGGEYEVLTNDEADQLWDEQLDQYLEYCVYPELPENMVSYFDNEAWKRDARMDGRAHCLNHYDGSEECEQVGGEYYYIYRTN